MSTDTIPQQVLGKFGDRCRPRGPSRLFKIAGVALHLTWEVASAGLGSALAHDARSSEQWRDGGAVQVCHSPTSWISHTREPPSSTMKTASLIATVAVGIMVCGDAAMAAASVTPAPAPSAADAGAPTPATAGSHAAASGHSASPAPVPAASGSSPKPTATRKHNNGTGNGTKGAGGGNKTNHTKIDGSKASASRSPTPLPSTRKSSGQAADNKTAPAPTPKASSAMTPFSSRHVVVMLSTVTAVLACVW